MPRGVGTRKVKMDALCHPGIYVVSDGQFNVMGRHGNAQKRSYFASLRSHFFLWYFVFVVFILEPPCSYFHCYVMCNNSSFRMPRCRLVMTQSEQGTGFRLIRHILNGEEYWEFAIHTALNMCMEFLLVSSLNDLWMDAVPTTIFQYSKHLKLEFFCPFLLTLIDGRSIIRLDNGLGTNRR